MALEPRLMYDGAAATAAAAATQPHADAGGSAGGSGASSAPSSAAPATDHAADHPAPPSRAATDSSGTSTPADTSAAGGSPPAPATPSDTSTSSHQIVFIDGNVPDAQVLAQGVQPGIEVVILDPDSNGVQQIADYLTSHNEQNLDAIQIVSHGEEATVRLGNTIFGLANISMFSPQLATIGQALKPGGDILFYGCNVGEGFDGALFEIQVSIATGGAHVAASSGLVGASSLGGSWTLDVADGTIDVGNPFTAATLGQYNDILTNQIWFSINNTTGVQANNEVATANVNGASATSVNAMPPGINGNSLSNWNNAAIALDAADGLYFIANNPAGVSGAHQQIFEGNISGSGGLTAIYTAPDTNGPDFFGGMVYNPANHKLYFVVDDNTAPLGFAPGGGVTIDTGIFTLNIAANGAASGLTKLVSWGAGSGAVNPHDIAIDSTDNLLFFTDYGDSQDTPQTFNPRIEVANLTTGAIINSSLQTISEPANGAYYFYGIDIDPVNHKLYWVTADPAVAAHNQVFGASFNASTGALSNVTALFTSSNTNLPISFAIDAANGVYYAGLNNGSSPTTIVEGSLSAPGAQTTILTLGTATKPSDVFYEPAPVLTVSGSPTTTPGGSAVDLSSSLTLVDTVQNIASASVTISAGKQTGDALAATTAGTSITASYNSSTGVLTLSGVDTAAHYQSVLDSVTFSTSSSASTSRTFTWSATDGHLASASPTTSATVHLPPVVTAGASVTYNGGGPAVLLDSTLNVTDPSSTTLTGATISISSGFLAGDTLNFTAQNGITIQSNVNGVLTLTGTTTLANYKTALESITYSFSGGGDPTNGGSATSRTISWTVNDGVASSTAVTSALTIVHTAPTVTASGTVTFTGGDSPVTLDSGLVLGNLDSASLVSATISISVGFQSGIDVLSVNLAQSGGKITGTNISVSYNGATGVLSLTGSDSFANYQNALDHVQYSVGTNADPTNGGSHTSRTISWSVKDNNSASNTSNTGTSSLTTVHQAPSLSISGSPNYSAGGAAVTLLSAVTLTDVDSGGNLAGATISITSGFLAGDALNFTAQNGITIQSNVNGVLTLTGSSSIANYATALQSITFSSSAGDPTNGGADTSRTIQWTVKDSSTTNGTSSVSSLILGVSAPPPSITGAGGPAVAYFALGAAVTLDGSLGVTDLASTTLAGATVTVTGNHLLGDTLTADTTGTSITARYDTVQGVLTLSGSDTLAHYQTVLDRITYNSTAPDPTAGGSANNRTISWQVNDGRATNNLSTTVTTTVDVTHVAPVVTAGASVTYDPTVGPVVLDGSLTLSDAQTGTLTGATITLGNRQTGDTLSFANTPNITGGYTAATGILTLSGTDTLAHYQAALESITYSSTASDPTQGGTAPSRTVSWRVTDNQGATSGAASSTVGVLAPPSNPSTIGNASSFPPGTTAPPGGTSGLAFSPGGTSGADTSSTGTLGSGTSGIVTLGSGTTGSSTFGFTSFSYGAFDPNIFGSGAGGPSYFDPGGGFGSGLDFSGIFTTASNDVPADSDAPITLVADSSLDIGFDRRADQTGKDVDDATPAVPEKAIAVAAKDAASPNPVHVPEWVVAADPAPVAGKAALSAQLRAAGRHGLLHDRLALLKSLRGIRG